MSERGFANVFDLIHYIDSLCRHRLRVRTVPLFQGGRSAVCANDCVCCRQRDVRTADRNLAAPGKRADQRKLSYRHARYGRKFFVSVQRQLRANGFRISMDDFGTGYSSFSLLTEMPLNTLKLDKSFVDKVGGDSDRKEDIAVIRHIVSLAKELEFVCLAEGAETKSQVDKLRNLGCELIQGYYYSRPIPIAEYESRYIQ